MNLDDDDVTLSHISWVDIQCAAESMATHILQREKPDVVIAHQNDIIAAALVCNIIKVPLCIAHLDDRQQDGIILECLPKINKTIRSGVYDQGPLPTVAIISTLNDNNHNADDLVSYYQKRGHPVKTFMYVNPQ